MKGCDGDGKGKSIWYQKKLHWFLKKMQRDCRWQVRNISNFSSIERTNGKYKCLYVDVYRNEK